MSMISVYIIIPTYFPNKASFFLALIDIWFGCGNFLTPFLVEWLNITYGLSGSMLVVAGISLHLCVVGALFRPIKQDGRHETHESDDSQKSRSLYKIRFAGNDIQSSKIVTNELGDSKQRNTHTPMEGADNKDNKVFLEPIKLLNVSIERRCPDRDEDEVEIEMKDMSNESVESGCPDRKRLNEKMLEDKIEINNMINDLVESIVPDRATSTERKSATEPQGHLDWRALLTDSTFLVTALAFAAFRSAEAICSVYLPTLALERGFDTAGLNLTLSVVAIGDMLFVLPIGILLSVKRVKPYRRYIYASFVITIGLAVFGLGFATDLNFMLAIAGLYSLTRESLSCQMPAIALDIFGTENLASALGLLAGFAGVSCTIGVLLGGK